MPDKSFARRTSEQDEIAAADRRLGGGRSRWAHFEFARMNIAPTFRRKEIEEKLEENANYCELLRLS